MILTLPVAVKTELYTYKICLIIYNFLVTN